MSDAALISSLCEVLVEITLQVIEQISRKAISGAELRACLAVPVVGERFARRPGPAEASDWHGSRYQDEALARTAVAFLFAELSVTSCCVDRRPG